MRGEVGRGTKAAGSVGLHKRQRHSCKVAHHSAAHCNAAGRGARRPSQAARRLRAAEASGHQPGGRPAGSSAAVSPAHLVRKCGDASHPVLERRLQRLVHGAWDAEVEHLRGAVQAGGREALGRDLGLGQAGRREGGVGGEWGEALGGVSEGSGQHASLGCMEAGPRRRCPRTSPAAPPAAPHSAAGCTCFSRRTGCVLPPHYLLLQDSSCKALLCYHMVHCKHQTD